MHSSRRDAFQSINSKPLAIVDFASKKVYANDFEKSKGKLKISKFKENTKVGLVKVHTNMLAEEFLAYKNFDGLIIEGTGLAGNIPINVIDKNTKEHEKISKAISTLVKKGVIVAATMQTIYGRINMNVYSTGRKMQQLGIIGNLTDMTPETAFIKLSWLLSNYPKAKVPELYSKNLRGEISERVEHDAY